MLKPLIHLVALIVFLNPLTLMANQVLKIGVGNFPPFFVKEDSSGIFIEITNAIFKQLPDYEIEYIFMSNNRLAHEINTGKFIDIACNIFSGSQINSHLSQPVFRYRDVAITKKSSGLTLNSVTDLNGKSIAAYQGAKTLLGKEFYQMANKNTQYTEYAHPKETTHLLLSEQKQVRIGDINIFWHDLKNRHYKYKTEFNAENFNIHYLWPDVYSHMAFKDEKLKITVDKIITKLKANGAIEAIYAKYQLQ